MYAYKAAVSARYRANGGTACGHKLRFEKKISLRNDAKDGDDDRNDDGDSRVYTPIESSLKKTSQCLFA